MLDVGSVLKKRYVIERHLGKGGMGSVYLATDRTFGSKVALKETIVHGSGLEEAFEREARVLNKLRHGAVPVVMDYFIEGDGRFLVMQYIPGDDLSALIDREKKAFPPDKVLEWADKLLDALTYLHTQDPPIIHRDIKPQNLKLTDRNEIVLLDFGLSKAAGGGDVAAGVSVAGYTPSYAPLEQIQGEGTDARTDIFSLAATVYHLLTGKKPIDAIRRVTGAGGRLRPIHELAPHVSRQVSDVIMSGLEIDPAKRPATAAEFRTALRGAAFDDLLMLAQEFGGSADDSSHSSASPDSESAAAAGVSSDSGETSNSDLPTVMNPLAVGSSTGSPAPASPVVAPNFAQSPPAPDLPTVIIPPVVASLGGSFPNVPSPAPVAKNTTAPSTVSFVYETATLGADGSIEKRDRRVARSYFEGAGAGASIPMVEIAAGTALLGSPEDEAEREACEGPRVEVAIKALFVSRSPITQAQWRAVATSMPQVRLTLAHAPSHFVGDERPVETISWEEAREFCDRLSAHTGRDYRLPSEAEWDYACRSGATTAFAFGPTLTTEIANVEGAIPYGEAPGADGRSGTTPVESLRIANRFGLYDMHGNVWEWTEDRWHDTLAGAPADGTAWVEDGDATVRVIRGGGWSSIPADARSAKRFSFLQTGRRNDVGFRVVMAPAGRT